MSIGMAVIMKPTYACNACCDYCSIHKMGEYFKPMNREDYSLLHIKLAEYLKPRLKDDEKAFVTFYWLGGEPLMMSNSFYDDIDKISRKSTLSKIAFISHAMQSNLTILAKKDRKSALNLLKNFPHRKNKSRGNYHISSSIDPVSDARKMKDKTSYDKSFLKAINFLKRDGASYSVVYTVHKGSIGHEREIYYYIKNLGCSGFNINAICDYDGKFENELDMTPQEYGIFMIKMWDIWEQDRYKVNITPFISWKILMERGDSSELRCFNDGKCDASLCAVGPNGDIFTCDRAMQAWQKPLGNIKNNSFDEMFSKKTHQDRISYLKENQCKGCKWWNYCRGSCPYESRGEFRDEFDKSYWCEAYKMFFEYIHRDIDKKSNQKPKIKLKVLEKTCS